MDDDPLDFTFKSEWFTEIDVLACQIDERDIRILDEPGETNW
jgi:hypothetical protein